MSSTQSTKSEDSTVEDLFLKRVVMLTAPLTACGGGRTRSLRIIIADSITIFLKISKFCSGIYPINPYLVYTYIVYTTCTHLFFKFTFKNI